LTIAVRDNQLPSEVFRRPTMKAGLPHVEAPRSILDNMLTLRVHLDDVTPENGPLKVIAGSHRHENDATAESQFANDKMRDILVQRGDVLAMRPRIIHGSIGAAPGTQLHRRVLHLEFAAREQLPDGFAWADFHAKAAGTTTRTRQEQTPCSD
jgi:ectoine hydroxylase-related dioxygenase (phytanoyl-CoA dioxygenase family)